MFFRNLLLVSFLVAATTAAPVDHQSLEFVLANLTALWQEVNELRRDVNYHVHEGKIDQDYNLDQALEEVSALAHEHHVHHLQHPHEGHMDHHNADMLQHLEAAHGHGDHGTHGHGDHDAHGHGDHDAHGPDEHSEHGDHDPRGDHGTHGHSSDEFDSEEDTRSPGRGGPRPHGVQDNCGDPGRRGGALPDNCGDKGRRGMHRGHGHRRGGHRDHSRHGRHGGHDDHSTEEDDSQEDLHDLHGLENQISGHVNSDAQFYEADHYQQETHVGAGHRGHGHGPSKGGFVDSWEHAYCNLLPNSELPDSHVMGQIEISQRADSKTGVFFDVDISGFDASQIGGSFGIIVHENPSEGQNCNTAGEFLGADGEITGFIGDLYVNDEGEMDHEITNRDDIVFNDIIGRAIVVHDVGTPTRLACCNIFKSSPMRARGSGGHHH